MEKKTLSEAVAIQAPKEKVWELLTQQPYLNEWTSAFMPNSTVTGKFADGAQILYADDSGNGVTGKVTEYKPNESLTVSILAEMTNGQPDYNHPDTPRWEGAFDHYQLSEENGVTTLTVNSAFPAEFENDFIPGWHKMLQRFKELAEK